MQGKGVLVMAFGSIIISGCAGPRFAQELNRLKSDVGLLDQRVSQLERASLQQPLATWPTEPQTQPSTAGPAAPTPTQPSTPSTLKPSTKEIQQALKAAGFYQGSLDGKLGPQTREAIKEFQRINGLKVDGVVGKQTWAKLQPYLDLAAGGGELSAAEPLK